MDRIVSKLTVFFEEPFWIGIIEIENDGNFAVCKITFGAEPKDYEVYDFLLTNWQALRFSPSFEVNAMDERRINPKRRQRIIKNQLQDFGVGTKAQQALKLQQEQGKLARKTRSREQKEVEKVRQFTLRQEKRKEKHRGR